MKRSWRSIELCGSGRAPDGLEGHSQGLFRTFSRARRAHGSRRRTSPSVASAPASDGDGGSGGAKPPGQARMRFDRSSSRALRCFGNATSAPGARAAHGDLVVLPDRDGGARTGRGVVQCCGCASGGMHVRSRPWPGGHVPDASQVGREVGPVCDAGCEQLRRCRLPDADRDGRTRPGACGLDSARRSFRARSSARRSHRR